MKLSVLIPVYDEKPTIEIILQKIRAVPVEKELIMVDDFSKDGSREILKEIESRNEPDLKILYHDKNQGKGAAIRTGLKEVTGDYVLIQDADLEYDPNDYLDLIQALQKNKADVVYGSRFLGVCKNMSLSHYFGNKLLTFMANLLYGTKLTDIETCYKLWKKDLIKSIDFKANRFEFEPEITSKMLKKNIKIIEVPIHYDAREFDQGKKISWKDGFSSLWTLIKYRFKS
ncbi:MAG: glycosyltransferase family 2 protein [Candidatus Margulisbacteria bacterium]|nr:glycosyltransferase family 2 protein [Candidatus Margulisiibacteriota bacterium]